MEVITDYTIERESIEDQLTAHRFNPCLELTLRERSGEHTYKISAGYADHISVYREDGLIHVLSHNPHLDYVGLEVFQDGELVTDIFLQGDDIPYIFGDRDRSPCEMVKRLMDVMV
jgi:hypothetical protein